MSERERKNVEEMHVDEQLNDGNDFSALSLGVEMRNVPGIYDFSTVNGVVNSQKLHKFSKNVILILFFALKISLSLVELHHFFSRQ